MGEPSDLSRPDQQTSSAFRSLARSQITILQLFAEQSTRSRPGHFAPKSAGAGIALIAFLAVAEVIPVASTLGACPRFFTAHLVLRALPGAIQQASSLWLAPAAMLLLAIALAPALKRGLRLVPAAMLVAGLSFFPIAAYIHNAQSVGPLWLLLGLVWLGANLWFRDVDYFYATVLSALIWDLGAGVQGLLYTIGGLPEPYGNGVSPIFVTAADCAGIVVVIFCWAKRLDPERPLMALPGPLPGLLKRTR